MGVPKFFRWLVERYPSVITPFRDAPPPTDNLYVDMNGIIHSCTHPNDVDATHRAPTEKAMMEAMFSYLEKLFNAIQPRKYFFLAVDGVAPRAKMNHQRQRRFRSGYEMMIARKEAAARGEEITEESDVFDSNCITPGTNFMVTVSEQFRYFIMKKVSTDPAWRNCNVIYSGHDHPGEGEHKIVDFIRRRKMQPGYSPNETHCMYGLDADLVMLALATHEPHFVLLREVVTFGQGQEPRRVREQREKDESEGIVADKSYRKPDDFVLFYVNTFRDYLDIDIRDLLGSKLPDNYDLERVVDDFVLMCFFVGNDFLPGIPTVGINDGSLVQMLDLYVQRVLLNSKYLTEKGCIQWEIVEVWLRGLADLEFTTIKAREAKEQEYQRRMAQHHPEHEVTAISTSTVASLEEYKERYYRDKHQFANGWDPLSEDMNRLRLHYVEGIMWVIGYYYQGPPSWRWYFPHHYAPMASDMVNLPALAKLVRFDLGEPFLPHQQLLAVLPPMSYRSMPRAYWPLLRSRNSPLARYFPEELQIDREGTRAPWEGVLLIPFIDERTLLAAYESVQGQLTPDEREHNRLGPPARYTYDTSVDAFDVPNAMFGPLRGVTVRREDFEFPPLTRFNPCLCPGVYIGEQQLEGFTTLRSRWGHIFPQRENGVVTIFGAPSRGESLLLMLRDRYRGATAHEVSTIVGQEVLVGFPHYRRARVVGVSDNRVRISLERTPEGVPRYTRSRELDRDASANFTKECEAHRQCMREKLGLLVRSLTVLVYVNLFVGMRVTRRGRIVRSFSKEQTAYALPLVAPLMEFNLMEDCRNSERNADELDCAPGSDAVYIGAEPETREMGQQRLFGSCGVVVRRLPGSDGSFSIMARVFKEPITIPKLLVDYASSANWVALPDLASSLRVDSQALKRLVGSVHTTSEYGSREIGLGLLYTHRNLARVGYVKQTARNSNARGTPGGGLAMGQSGAKAPFARDATDAPPVGHYMDNAQRGETGGRFSRPVLYFTWFSVRAVEVIKTYVESFEPLVKLLGCIKSQFPEVDPPAFMFDGWADCEVNDVLESIEAFIGSSGIRDTPLVAAQDDAFPQEYVQLLEEEVELQLPRRFTCKSMSSVQRQSLYFPVTRSINGHVSQLPVPLEQEVALGSRVVNCRACGAVPFGATGTVIRLLSSGFDAEVLYDEPFVGGSYFDGRLRKPRGAISKLSALLVIEKCPSTGNGPPRGQVKCTLDVLKGVCCKARVGRPKDKERLEEKAGASASDRAPGIPRPCRSSAGSPPTAAVTQSTVSQPSLTTRGGVANFKCVEDVEKVASDPEPEACGAEKTSNKPTTGYHEPVVAPPTKTATSAGGGANQASIDEGDRGGSDKGPNSHYTILQEVLSGELKIRPGEGALFLKRMVGQHLTDDNKSEEVCDVRGKRKGEGKDKRKAGKRS